MAITGAIYLAVGAGAYLLFGRSTREDVLENFTAVALAPLLGSRESAAVAVSSVIQLSYATSLLFTYPLVNWALRQTVADILFGGGSQALLSRYVSRVAPGQRCPCPAKRFGSLHQSLAFGLLAKHMLLVPPPNWRRFCCHRWHLLLLPSRRWWPTVPYRVSWAWAGPFWLSSSWLRPGSQGSGLPSRSAVRAGRHRLFQAGPFILGVTLLLGCNASANRLFWRSLGLSPGQTRGHSAALAAACVLPCCSRRCETPPVLYRVCCAL